MILPAAPSGVAADTDTPPSLSGTGFYPSFSVVICTRNRPIPLMACVRSVVQQTVRPCELIVVDDGELSAQERRSIALICESVKIRFIYLKKSSPGLPQSRNLGVRHAGGTIIQFLDDDVTLEPDFCREILQLYSEDSEGTLIGTEGNLKSAVPPSFGSRIFDFVYMIAGWWALRPRPSRRLSRPAFLQNRHRAEPTWNIVGATMAFRRNVLLENPFDEALAGYALGEDRDMAYRLGRKGWIVRVLTARAVHHHDPVSRPDPYNLGRMVVDNYFRILTRNGFIGVGDRLVIGYSLLTVALSLAVFSLWRPWRYLPEFIGMVAGAARLICNVILSAYCRK